MRIENSVKKELYEWSHRPPSISEKEAARNVIAALGEQAPRRSRPVLRPILAVAAAALIAVVALYSALRGRSAHSPAAGTTAAITLSSGTQVVIELKEAKP